MIDSSHIAGESALTQGAYRGNQEIVRLLLSNPRIDVNVKNQFGKYLLIALILTSGFATTNIVVFLWLCNFI